jgi:adenosine deaminase
LIDRAWLRGLPKAELHVHLEGTTTPEAYARIARRHGLEIPADPASLFRCSDFESFLNAFMHVVKAFREPVDFAEITASYLEESAREGVRHVEFFFSPATLRHFFKDIHLESIVAAIHQECVRARRTHGVSSLLVFDMVRNLGEDAAFADIDLAFRCKSYRVVGVGLGGDERKFPARDFQRAFERAERLGLRRTVHAGEVDGFHSIVDAIELLHAERIGHAVAAAGEEEVMQLMRARGVAVDACLTSNAVTGAWNGRGDHPVGEFLKEGIAVALSSDDPSFFGSSLVDEYERAAGQGLGRAEIVQLARNSFQSSFASAQEKRTWLRELDAYLETARART